MRRKRFRVYIASLMVLFAAIFVLIPNKTVSAESYAKEWTMSEGKSYQIISGSLATNTNGQPYDVMGGQQSSFFVIYHIMPKDVNAPDLIEAGKIAFKIKLPKDFKGELGRVANDNWTLKEGNKNNPNGTPINGDNRYYWMISTVDMPITSSDTLTFFTKPFVNGVSGHDSSFKFDVSLMNMNNNTNVSGEQESSFKAITNKFKWNNVSASTTGENQVFQRDSQDNAIDNPIDDLSFNLSTSANPNNVDYNTNTLVYGSSYAKSIIFNNTFKLPVDGTDSCPLIKIDKSMFVDESGQPLADGIVTLNKDDSNNVIGFNINVRRNNPDTSKQYNNPNFKFKIKGAKLNGDCSTFKDMQAGESKSFAIEETSNSHQVVPLANLDSTISLNEDGNLNIAQNNLMKLNFTYKTFQKETPLDSYKDTQKVIKTIAGKPVSGENLVTYPGDIVQFELGAEHINNKNTNDINLSYEEKAGVDYDPSKIVPTQLRVGNVSGKVIEYNIDVTYKDGSIKNYKRLYNQILVFENPEEIDTYKISHIITPNNTLQVGHVVDYRVIDHKDLSKDGMKISNKVHQTYSNGEIEKKSEDEVSFTYKLKPINKAGLSETNKSGKNLAGPNDRSIPKPGDVVQFTIYVRDDHGAELHIDEIIDHYTKDTLVAYNGNTTKIDGSDSIDSRFLNNSTPINLVLWDADPNLSTSTPIAFPGNVNPIITNQDGIMKFKFNEDLVIPSNKSYYLTYTMATTPEYDYEKNMTIGNEFNSYRNGFKNGEGLFYWSKPGTSGEISIDGNGKGSQNKWHKNASVPSSISYPWTSYPYGGDVAFYMARITNNTKVDWEGDVEFNDSYSEELKPFQGKSGLNENCVDCEKLNYDNPYNMNGLKKGETITIRGSQGLMKLESTATEFDPSKLEVVDNYPSQKSFKVKLGDGNKIKAGESIYLVYTMQVEENVSPSDDNEFGTKENEIINTCEVTYKGSPNGNCSDTWHVNPNENIKGVVDLTKGVTKVTNNHSYNRIENNDKIDYKVSMSNDHIKANRYVKIETLIDKLPSNLKYVDNSFKIKFFETEYETNSTNGDPNSSISGNGIKKEIPLPNGANDYTLTLVDSDGDGTKDSIRVDWNAPIDLTAGEYTDDTFQKIKTFSYEFDYTLQATTANIPENTRLLDQKNRVQVFTTNSSDELNRKNGTIIDDKQNNLDGKDSTKSYIYQEANVKIINDGYNYGSLNKVVSSGGSAFNVDGTNEGRSYKVTISNTGAKNYSIARFVDILPKYEKYKVGSLKINNQEIDENLLKIDEFSNSTDPIKNERLKYTKDIIINANSNLDITYSTIVDKDAIGDKMIENKNNEIKNLNNSFAFYIKDNAKLLIADGGSGHVDNGNVPDDNWDDDINTSKRYEVKANVSYIDNVIVPGVDITPYILLDSGNTQPYVHNVTPINPGDNLAWRIKLGNANNASTKLLKGSKVVVVLPEGVSFDEENSSNQYIESTGASVSNVDTSFNSNTSKPSWLSDPVIKKASSKQQIIVWTINDGDYNRGQGAGFTIKTTTQQYRYTAYAPEVYLVPLQQKDQDFYDNVMDSTSNNLQSLWPGYEHQFGDLSDFYDTDKISHYVKDSTFVDVYGAYGLSAYKKISDSKTTITSRDADRILKLDTRRNKFKYTLRLESVKSDTRLTNLVFIDRLPSINDTGVVTDLKRESQAPVRLDNNGNVKVLHRETNATNPSALDNSQYRIEYFFGPVNEKFTNNDKNGIVQEGRWYKESDALAAGKELSKATALRIAITDQNIIIGSLGDIEIIFDAHLGEKVEDYNKSEAPAFNSFGYSLAYGAAQNDLKSETVSVGVSAVVPDAKVTINKDVDLDNHIDTKTREYFESIASNRKFSFKLIGKDENNDKQFEKDLSINTNISNNKGYSGKQVIENLDPTLKYSLVEQTNSNFKVDMDMKTKIVEDQMQYTFDVKNTWQPMKLDVNKKWLDVNGLEIPQTNINKLLNNYVEGDVDVELFNEANASINHNTGEVIAIDDPLTTDVDESTLPIEDLKIKTTNINLNKLNNTLGYVNKFDSKNNKIKYGVNESLQTLNHNYFKVVTTYNETNPNLSSFNISNKIIGGGVELLKKDDLNNNLSNVKFELEDILGNKTLYQTDTNGLISIDSLNPGKYKFKEVEAPFGYHILEDAIEFTIQPNAPTKIELNVTNKIIRGSVELTKKDDLNNVLPGAQFELYDKDDNKVGGTYTTKNNGKIIVDKLIPNDYYFIETKAPQGYIKSEDKIEFTVQKSPTKVEKVSALNKVVRGDVKLTKKDERSRVLEGAQFYLYNKKNARVGGTYISDVSGQIKVDKLAPGDYYFKEVKAPDGYYMMPFIKDRNYKFTIPFNPKKTINVNAYNHQALEMQLKSKKVVLGKNVPNSKYKFVLQGDKKAPMPQGSKGNKKIVYAKEGRIDFDTITYNKIGTYSYTLYEAKGSIKGMNYDNTKYKVNVNVGFDGRKLVSKTTYQKENKKIYKEAKFINRYGKDGNITTTGSDNLYLLFSLLIGGAAIPLTLLNRKFKKYDN